jgi:hypothetical protein
MIEEVLWGRAAGEIAHYPCFITGKMTKAGMPRISLGHDPPPDKFSFTGYLDYLHRVIVSSANIQYQFSANSYSSS